MSTAADRLEIVLQAIAEAARSSKRDPSSITLVAVSKTKSVEEMQAFAQVARARNAPVVFGENYVQELKAKRPALDRMPEGFDELHLQGPLQSNKVRDAVRLFDLIQSVHSLRLIEMIAAEAVRIGKRQRILLQVNVSNDTAKSGFPLSSVEEAVVAVARFPESLALEGLMTITALYETAEEARPDFAQMRELRTRLLAQGLADRFVSHAIKLSMGMSADFAVAIEEGADLVRIGTALFGERTTQ